MEDGLPRYSCSICEEEFISWANLVVHRGHVHTRAERRLHPQTPTTAVVRGAGDEDHFVCAYCHEWRGNSHLQFEAHLASCGVRAWGEHEPEPSHLEVTIGRELAFFKFLTENGRL